MGFKNVRKQIIISDFHHSTSIFDLSDGKYMVVINLNMIEFVTRSWF
jgi:hypothetical protein